MPETVKRFVEPDGVAREASQTGGLGFVDDYGQGEEEFEEAKKKLDAAAEADNTEEKTEVSTSYGPSMSEASADMTQGHVRVKPSTSYLGRTAGVSPTTDRGLAYIDSGIRDVDAAFGRITVSYL